MRRFDGGGWPPGEVGIEVRIGLGVRPPVSYSSCGDRESERET